MILVNFNLAIMEQHSVSETGLSTKLWLHLSIKLIYSSEVDRVETIFLATGQNKSLISSVMSEVSEYVTTSIFKV